MKQNKLTFESESLVVNYISLNITSLQELKPVVQKFSNNEFRRSVMFPYLKLSKQNRR